MRQQIEWMLIGFVVAIVSLMVWATLRIPSDAIVLKSHSESMMNKTLTCIRHYESRGNYQARSRHNDWGAYQFKQSTWDSAGGPDWDGVRPDKAPPRIQDKRASRLIRIREEKGLDPLGKWAMVVRRNCR